MKIGITVWGNRISPVFDSAKKILIAQVCDHKVINRVFKDLEYGDTCQGIAFFKKHQIKTLICGAVTSEESEIIEEHGIRLIPFISGNAGEVLEAFVENEKKLLDYLMPGTFPKFK